MIAAGPDARQPDTSGSPGPALLDTAAAAAALGVRPQTLAEWRSLGRGPCFIRVSARRIRYRRADLDAWLDAQTRTHTRDGGATAAENATAPGGTGRGRGAAPPRAA